MPSETGVLIVNLGTPDAPTPAAVRRFLAEFLDDRRVIDLPLLPRRLLLYGLILPLRPRRSAAAYRRIWTDAGSPLLAGTARLTAAIGRRLATLLPPGPPVAMGMTYGQPSIDDAIRQLRSAGARRLVVLPLFPQKSATTTSAVLDRVEAALARDRMPLGLDVIDDYHADEGYIAALAAASSVAAAGRDHLLFSFHGIPRRYADAGDDYGERCQATARLVAARLALPSERWSVAFQSRVGGARWLGPYTEARLKELAAGDARRIAVACPGFPVDCLETLEEIAMRGRDAFLAAGGARFDYIPALNDGAAHVDSLGRLIAARAGAPR